MAEIRITATARKHRIAQSRIIAALNNAVHTGSIGDQEHFLGVDSLGVELELIIVPDDKRSGEYACIHAMPTRYRNQQQEEE
ncbi:hypothetical protein [Microlunatus parietis]|uniref:Uncharacterized protein n=1 Tax=Microlunatus parietis TaxID=682979 RepID=A0A7Y9I9K9_9ACTN|nr:hypothetical protein [Microlunatus parietis]NYE72785.1 hypothetical protein [Microlunatus parietis]